MKASAIIQEDVEPIKLSQAEPMEVVFPKKEQSLEDKCKLDKFVLPVKLANKKKHGSIEVEALSYDVSNIIQSTVKSVGAQKAKITIEVQINE